jgi:hypothetical protein
MHWIFHSIFLVFSHVANNCVGLSNVLLVPASLIYYKINFVALVHEKTIPTEPPLLVGEANANFCG